MSYKVGDRRVYAVLGDGSEIVRYDRTGKWYLEHPSGSLKPARRLRFSDAVALALHAEDVRLDVPGGGRFDYEMRKGGAA